MPAFSTTASFSRVVNALVLVTFSIVMLSVHLNQIHVPDEVEAICTARDVPVDCWEQGGVFRALQFTAPTTTVSFTNFGPGTIYDPDGTVRQVSESPYAVRYAPSTDQHTQASCAVDFAANEKMRAACRAERIQDLWEVPNRELYRLSWTLSGGVHIWYMLWISMWISASFAVVMLPEYLLGVQLPTLFVWHLLGIVLTVMFYVDDHYFQLRLPLNNVFIGIAIEAFAAMVQLYWTRESQAKRVARGGKLEARPVAGALGRLMALGRDGDEGGAPAAGAEAVTIFESKLESFELLEALYMEIAITFPPVAVAVFCMVSRVNMDWVVQSLYVRSFFIFVSMAVCFKVLKFTEGSKVAKVDTERNLDPLELWFVMFIFAVTALYLSIFFLLDWYTPMWDTVIMWGDGYSRNVTAVAVLTLVVMILLIIVFLVALVIMFAINGVLQSVFENKEPMQLWFFYGVQTLLLAFRCLLFAYAVSPKIWYEHFDKLDVPLNYP